MKPAAIVRHTRARFRALHAAGIFVIPRPSGSLRSLSTASLWLLVLAGCADSEVATVDRFLEASQRRDLGVLATLSVVPFPAHFDSWGRLERIATRREPFSLTELHGERARARAARRARLAEMSSAGESEEAIESVRAGFHARVQDSRRELARLRSAASRSLESWAELNELEGTEEVCEVRGIVRRGTATRDYVFTLKRFDLRHVEDGDHPASRWIVVGVRED